MTLKINDCWAKKESEGYHPVLHHLLDVGHIAQSFIGPAAPPRFRKILAGALGVDPNDIVNWLPFFIGLHDIGKFSPTFQALVDSERERLAARGFPFTPSDKLHHTLVGALFADKEWPTFDERAMPAFKRILRDVIAGHHGRFVGAAEFTEKHLMQAPVWRSLREQACRTLQPLLAPGMPESLPEPPNASAAIMALTGFTILCDWLGSASEHFPMTSAISLENYVPLSQSRALNALESTGFLPAGEPDGRATFTELFPHIASPHPIQKAIDEIPAEILQHPCLCIIEAPTGEGKTEAALTLARRFQETASEELYFALPTEATSNQMYHRVLDFLGAPVKLIHGHAFLKKDDFHLRLQGEPGDHEKRSASLEWFAPRKRALLAPYGVGTIDQAELAALNVPHNSLRLFGLAGKVLIVDEVHAYDTYMTTIIERLLEWLSALGTPVVLLSATLTRERRESLARAYGVTSGEGGDAYPLITISPRGQPSWSVSPGASQEERIIRLEWTAFGNDDARAKARALLREVEQGGCAAWICNTVDRSQRLYQELRRLAPEVPAILFHARFPLNQREVLEERIVGLYGPGDENRPERGIVVGTQVLEQSLDLDFDVLYTDLAPTDLLLQRAGRMHRHARNRPQRHNEPRLVINLPRDAGGALDWSTDAWIYDEFILQKTLAVLEGRNELWLPRQTRELVERTYDDVAETEELQRALEKRNREQVQARGEAELRLIPKPAPSHRFPFTKNPGNYFDEEEEGRAAWRNAQTRLGAESVNIVPLHRVGESLCLDSEGELPLHLTRISRETQLELLRHSLRLSHRSVVERLRSEPPETPPGFQQADLLRNYVPLVFEGGRCELSLPKGMAHLELDRELGLVVQMRR